METERIKLEVFVDLDPIPGAFQTEESARAIVEDILRNSIGHYDPVVVNATRE